MPIAFMDCDFRDKALERENVVSEDDLKDAVRRLEAGAADFGQEMDKARIPGPERRKAPPVIYRRGL